MFTQWLAGWLADCWFSTATASLATLPAALRQQQTSQDLTVKVKESKVGQCVLPWSPNSCHLA